MSFTSNVFRVAPDTAPSSPQTMASDRVALLKALASYIITVKDTMCGIKNVGKITRGLEEEIEAIAFFHSILEFEIRKSIQLPLSHDWWDEAKVIALLRNATKTFKRLQAILNEIRRQRTALQNVHEYYRLTQYDSEIQHLRRRITTYINAVKIPVFLLAMQVLFFQSAKLRN